MSFRKIAGFCVLIFAMISWPAMADMFVPSHSCMAPVKPDQFNNNSEITMFNDAVTEYKKCISTFADEQNQAADAHRRAAGQAIDEWNKFISESGLN